MSMLAERKRKQKWSLNPRGKAWSEDSNKFGQKLMEKMGWSHGKGLGAKEDGITEHIKVSYKNDSKGMGFKDRNDQWTEHESNFSALLSSLSGENSNENSVEIKMSLEKKSQSSKARVHYHKFTRGKDLSRYSEKDLANIFGKKSLKDNNTAPKQEEIKEPEENSKSLLFNAGSMLDYFKKKMPSFGQTNGFAVGSNGVLKKAEESEEEGHVGFGFQSSNSEENEKIKPTFISYISENTEEIKKKKRKGEDIDPETPSKAPRLDSETTTKDKKKKKKKQEGLTNPAFDPLHSTVLVEKHALNTISETVDEENTEDSLNETLTDQTNPKSKKNKKKNSEETDNSTLKESNSVIENTETNEELKENCKLKNKKKKKIKEGLNNPCFDVNLNSTPQTDNKEETFKKNKKKKKEEPLNNSLSTELEIKGNPYEVKIKKKKKQAEEINGIENPNFSSISISSETEIQENPFELKVKKKKKANEETINLSSELEVQENPYEVKIKKKKKTAEDINESSKHEVEENEVKTKKKKKNIEQITDGVENPNFSSVSSETEVQENPYEVKIKKKKRKLIEHNSVLEDSVEPVNPYEVKLKKKKRKLEEETEPETPSKKKKTFAIDNPVFENQESTPKAHNNEYEVKRKSKKKGLENPALNLEDKDLSNLSIATTPIIKKNLDCRPSSKKKNVRFSEVNEERIIPNLTDLHNMEIENRNELFDINTKVIENSLKEAKANGIANKAFDSAANSLEENLRSISRKIEEAEAEVENDINEKKLRRVQAEHIIGERGSKIKRNMKVKEGVKLKFKGVSNRPIPHYLAKEQGPKKSYKHLIRGDIVVQFKNSNLDEIDGYALNVNPKDYDSNTEESVVNDEETKIKS